MKFKPYPSYQPSISEAFGYLPSHWKHARVRYIVGITKGKNPAHLHDSKIESSHVPYLSMDYLRGYSDNLKWLTPTDETLIASADDVLLVWDGSNAGEFIKARTGAVSSTTALLKSKTLDIRYFYFGCKAIEPEIRRYTVGMGIPHVNGDHLKDSPFPLPPKQEQTAIATFLCRETAKIDTLISKQEKLIELLKEKRQAVISHAIHGTTEYRRVKLGRYVDLLPGYAFPSSEYSHNPDDVPLLRGINVGVEAVRWEETVFWPKDKCAPVEAFELKEGDLVFGMDRPWISEGTRIATVTQNDIPSLLLQRVCRLRALSGLRQDFLKLLLTEEAFKQYVEADLTGVSVPHISADQILSYQVNLPSESTQREACDFVFSEFKRIDDLTMKASQAISLLAEHRTALISAAVTGKIDVRESVPDLQEAA